MKKVGVYRAYKLYEVDNSDLEITGGTSSRYIRNSIIVFQLSEERPAIGKELFVSPNIDEAKAVIDSDNRLIEKKPIQETIKEAQLKSEERLRQQREENALLEMERKNREYRQSEIIEREKK